MDIFVGLSNALWAPLAYVALAMGVLITVATKGVVFRRFPDMIKGIFENRWDTRAAPRLSRR